MLLLLLLAVIIGDRAADSQRIAATADYLDAMGDFVLCRILKFVVRYSFHASELLFLLLLL